MNWRPVGKPSCRGFRAGFHSDRVYRAENRPVFGHSGGRKADVGHLLFSDMLSAFLAGQTIENNGIQRSTRCFVLFLSGYAYQKAVPLVLAWGGGRCYRPPCLTHGPLPPIRIGSPDGFSRFDNRSTFAAPCSEPDQSRSKRSATLLVRLSAGRPPTGVLEKTARCCRQLQAHPTGSRDRHSLLVAAAT